MWIFFQGLLSCFKLQVVFFYILCSVCVLFSLPVKAGGVVFVDQKLKHLLGGNAVCRKAAAERITYLVTPVEGQCPVVLRLKWKDAVSVTALLKLLEHEDVQYRLSAVSILGKMGDASAVLPLKKALKDKDSRIRAAAAYSLAELRDKRAVSYLVSLYDDHDVKVRRAVISALGSLDAAAAMAVILKALQDENMEIRSNAAFLAGTYGGEDAALPLVPLLLEKDSDVNSVAGSSLFKLPYKKKVEPLLGVLEKLDDNRRQFVFQAFGQEVDDAVLKAAKKILGNRKESIEVRQAVLHYLVGVVDKDEGKVTGILFPMLHQDDIPGNVLFAMGRSVNGRIVNYLIQNYQKFDNRIHEYVVGALGGMAVSGDEKAEKFLLQVLGDKKEQDEVRIAAAQSLAEAGVKAAVPLLWDFFHERENYQNSEAAITALAKLGEEQVVKRFVTFLKSEKATLRSLAVLGLRLCREANSVPALIQALKDKDPKIRIEILDALSNFSDPKIESAKIDALGDVDLNVRRKAVSVLISARSGMASEKLTALLKDGDEEIRFGAVLTLRVLGIDGVTGAVQGLVDGLKNDHAKIRDIVFKVLKEERRLYMTAEPILIRAYQDGGNDLKSMIIDLLGAYRTASAISELQRMSKKETGDLRMKALAVLKKISGGNEEVSLHCLREVRDLF